MSPSYEIRTLHPPGSAIDQARELCRSGKAGAAVALLDSRLAQHPDDTAAHAERSVIFARLGDIREARVGARRLAVLAPERFDAWRFIATLAAAANDNASTIRSLWIASILNPMDVAIGADLGEYLRREGRTEAAISVLQAAARGGGASKNVWLNLGAALSDGGRAADARTAYGEALALDPGDATTINSLAALLKNNGQKEKAAALLARLVLLEPDMADHLANHRVVLEASGPDPARVSTIPRASAKRELMIDPLSAPGHGALARQTLFSQSYEKAAARAVRTLVIDPAATDAWTILALSKEPRGLIQEMVDHLARAGVLDPTSPRLAYWRHLAIPPIMQSDAEISRWRTRYQAGLRLLRQLPGPIKDPVGTISASYFNLAYHGLDNREINEALGRLVGAKAPTVMYRAPHLAGWEPPAKTGRRFRLGILSRYLSGHTIGRIFRGLISHLDARIFDIVVIHAPESQRDAITTEIEAAATRVVTIPSGIRAQQQCLAELALDILFFPEIGMDAGTYLLTHSRLAPVQVTAWGHPDTTGLPTMDYFVSSALVEPQGADNHYTERLIKLSRLPCVYRPATDTPATASRADLGLPVTGTLYACPQSLFKLHPDFDQILADIAAGDPDGTIVLAEGNARHWKDLLRARWADRHPSLLDRVIFHGNLRYDDFLTFLGQVDVMLDPPHFGGGGTMYEAMIVGTPVVTWLGGFMRGRFAASAYRQMGITAPPIAERLEDYAALALALGRDVSRRQALREELTKAAREHLFMDVSVAREYEHFFVEAVKAAGFGERLPIGWRAPID